MKDKIKYIKQIYLTVLLTVSVVFLNAQESDSYSILLTGNTSESQPSSELLDKWINASNKEENLALLMLGNVLSKDENKFSEDILSEKSHPLLLAPGEKEWANGRSSGKEMIKDIEDKLAENNKGQFYMPDAACPGPKEVVLNDHLVVILIDTHWWVHKHDRRYLKCGIETNEDVMILIEDAVRRHYQTKHVVIAGHHSLKSFGNSDGYFSLKQNILEAPYTFYRKVLGSRKDNHHPDFKVFRNSMLSILKQYPDIIYTSAGDANLQYFTLDNTHHIVAGSMNKSEFVRSELTDFGSSENGFAQLNFSDNGKCELIFTGSEGNFFQKTIYQKEFISEIIKEENSLHVKDSIIVKASDKYYNPKAKYLMKGENYRKIWDTPIKVPVFNILTEKEGLLIVKRGGGQQTFSLRLEDKNGKQYVLRSIEKNVEPILPEGMRNTFAVDLVQDQISTSNPYAALVVAQLAEAAGVFHTNPKIVYVTDDPNFGIYRQDAANQLFIFEERPDDDRTDVASFGYSENIISTADMIENIHDNENHFIDSVAYLKARLFDIFINDWDRHEDQWRWAGFKVGNKTIYKPIPRDRDQAFFLNEGVVAKVSSRKWLSPRFQKFDEFTENVEGLSFNARWLDRTLLIQNNWEDWQTQIDSLKILLTDEKIDKAVLGFPNEVQDLSSDETSEILKARIKNLEPMARKLYLFLAKEVSLTGTNSSDLFKIDVPDNKTVRISRFRLKNKKEKEVYSRVFDASETNQIHIYGFDKNDRFELSGKAKNKIEVSIIGGKDKDEIIYSGKKSPGFITIYDKNNSELSDKVKNRLVNNYDKEELKYDKEHFKYDIVYPAVFTGYNQDDGVFLGGGAKINKYSRYQKKQFDLLANYAFLTNSFNLHFAGENIYSLKHLELGFVADFKSPNFTNNYFGMGNETVWLVDQSEKDYYRVRMSEYYTKVNFAKFLDKKDIHKIGLGFFYKNTDVEETSERFISDFVLNGLLANDLLSHSYAGASFNYKMNTIPSGTLKRENKFGGSNMFPTRGIQLETEFSQFIGLNDNSQKFSKISGNWTSYTSFSKRPRFVYAMKLGGEKLFGDYVFTEAAKLGQNENLRGYRQTRFYGDASLYLNTEIRIRVKDFNSYFLNGTAGLFVFNDLARVWFEDENSTVWHDGFGGGLWWSPFDMTLITVSYQGSKEDNFINFSLNYQF